ncbi:MAG TPA: phosphoribosyltransferase [Solirubrobacteraceae bacterium]|jgi:putative phosphoribosyl transferase|nr:phosphoribosyltransferase [Solirubrobacteraceae bacterium]
MSAEPSGTPSDEPGARLTGAIASLDDPPCAAPGRLGFRDRRDAGRQLAALLAQLRDRRPVVVAIPRGGVPVAAEVASAIGAPLDVVLVRKVGAPRNPEYAIGAVAEGGVHVLAEDAVRALGLTSGQCEALVARGEEELRSRLARYRGTRAPVELRGRTVILVDDGLATGRSAVAAVRSVRKRGGAQVILAVPVGARQSVQELSDEADEVVCVELPSDLWAVGYWYEDFRPTGDAEVAALLVSAAGNS